MAGLGGSLGYAMGALDWGWLGKQRVNSSYAMGALDWGWLGISRGLTLARPWGPWTGAGLW